MSYTLNKTGAQIDAILDRAAAGGQIDQDIALKAPLASPALTGTPTAPTPADGDNSTKIATTAFVKAATGQLIEESIGPDDILSIPDGADNVPMLSLKAYITALQDLHGYSAPWPAGGGKNLVGLNTSPDGAIIYNNVSASDHTDNAVTLTSANATSTNMRLNYTIPEGTYTLKYQADSSSNVGVGVYVGNTIQGGIVSPNTAATFTFAADTAINIRIFATLSTAEVRTVTISDFQLEAGSTATAWTPYSNICPISGWTGANGTVTGKNLYNSATTTVGVWLTTDTGLTEAAAGYWTSDYIPVLPSSTYYLNVQKGSARNWYYDKNKNPLSYYQNGGATTFTTPAGAAFLRITGQTSTIPYNGQIQFEKSSTESSYEAYNGTTYIQEFKDAFGNTLTVYGGNTGLISGVLTVTHKKITLNGTQSIYLANWAPKTNSIGWIYEHTVANGAEVVAASDIPSVISDSLSAANYNSLFSNDIIGVGFYSTTFSRLVVRVNDPTLTTSALINAYLSNNPIDVVYPLATPQTYSLTGLTIPTLKGENNVWADCGQSEMTYYADLKAYIDKKIAEAL